MESVKVGGKDFESISVLGEGGYGKVTLVRKVNGWDKGRLYAMKQMRKTTNMKKMRNILNERKVLEQVREKPFLATLQYAFETPADLIVVLDYVNGGDMFTKIAREGRLSEGHVQFYVGELVLALHHMHNLKIVHRDIKPENIMIDSGGHVVLTDFGLSKFLSCEKAENRETGGTTRYVAPEVVKCSEGENLGYPVDWWALGVVTYEFLTGRSPFTSGGAENFKQDVLRRILRNNPSYPSTMSFHARDFVKALLTTDPNKRLGAHGAGEVKKHLFFHGLSWEDLSQKKIPPPFIPSLKNDLDVSNFPKEFTDMALEEPAEAASFLCTCDSNNLCSLTHPSSKLFKGFAYVAPAIHVTESPNSELPDTGMIEPPSATASAPPLPHPSNGTPFSTCRSERSPRSAESQQVSPSCTSYSMTTDTSDEQLRHTSNSSRGSTTSLGFTFRKGSDGLRGSTDCVGFAVAGGSNPSRVRQNFIERTSSSNSSTSSKGLDVDRLRTGPLKNPSGGENIRPTSNRVETISIVSSRALSRVSRGRCPRSDEKAAEVELAVSEHGHELHDVDNMTDCLNNIAKAVWQYVLQTS